ncbi:uncharacterized protein F4822DRAFT_440757 [Hypoxylon trugodes]|uniref:uncharacterized protein n=1 Tax=Hypoxylon trugodes TaxID=326681 RepID=UPI00219D0E49|nr:uncharacterized protein F4822DRAFT_440757 [Hypoxylon trugodes]KAI1383059.1 hypothetical protein F4822DRAFT_440757 [Hypoxylon trugodes]
MSSPYFDYVQNLSQESPGPSLLFEFLRGSCLQPEVEQLGCNIASLEFYEDGVTEYSRLNAEKLASQISRYAKHDTASKAVGLCVLVEDVRPDVVEILGGAFDINPNFFGEHIEKSFVEIERNPPSSLMTSLPTRVGSEGFVNIHYQRPINLGDTDTHSDFPYEIYLRNKVTRPGRCLPALFGKRIGFIRSCFSMLHKRINDDRWICLMLMDSLSADVMGHLSADDNVLRDEFRVRQVPYRRRKNQNRLVAFSEFQTASPSKEVRPMSMLDEVAMLIQECTQASKQLPSTYDISILAVGPIKLIIDEWLTYSLIMGRYVKAYEYSIKNVRDRLCKFDSVDILELYRWRRRSQQSLYKLNVLRHFAEFYASTDGNNHGNNLHEGLARDISYVIGQINQNGKALEAMMPIMTSIIQLLDSRRSTIESIYVKRLAYPPLVFLLPSLVTSLFNMSEPFSITSSNSWIYIVVAMII